AEYNLGRAFHHIGLTHLAIPHYESALKLPSLLQVLKQQTEEEDDDQTDLKKETAYNLSLIYNESGSPGLAALLLKKY
ncbi:17691_t:CDS:2, partial [Acaulospora morrowiae]